MCHAARNFKTGNSLRMQPALYSIIFFQNAQQLNSQSIEDR